MHRKTCLLPILPQKAVSRKRWCIRDSNPDRSVRSRVLYPVELRMHRETYLLQILIPRESHQVRDGASGRIRTSDRSVRSRVLCPAGVTDAMAVEAGFEPRMLLTAYPSAGERLQPLGHLFTTRLLRVLRRTCSAHRRCVAHILLSGTYKSNNFSRAFYRLHTSRLTSL